ncbi:MAG: hypothetical protein MI673_00730, partial [Thiotrichales bacterium]|nr:hypothetical protein [Thiotrichales bacterium]
MNFTEDDVVYELALNRIPGISSGLHVELVKTFSTARDVFLATDKQLLAAGVAQDMLPLLREPDLKAVEK